MIPELRRAYNEAFTEERYRGMLRDLESTCGCRIGFAVSETPLFLSEEIAGELQKAAWEILGTVTSDDYLQHTGQTWISSTHIDCVGRDFDIWIDDEAVMRDGKFLR